MTAPVQRKGPDDYWRNPSFAHRYVSANVVTANDNVGARAFFATCLSALAQGIAYLNEKPTALLYAGCGHGIRGNSIQAHFGARVVGCDYSQAMLEEATKLQRTIPTNRQIELVEADVRNLPFEDNSFDAVFHYGLIMSLPEAGAGLREMMRVARYGTVGIEETDAVMDDVQLKYFEKARTQQFPGRIYWHDYLREYARAGAAMIHVTPLPVPDEWDLGEPPGYARFIGVKRAS